MSKSDRSINLVWYNQLPAGREEEINQLVCEDLERNLGGSLEKPSELIFHTAFIGNTMYDEAVAVWGNPNDNKNFHCEYVDKIEWVNLSEEESK